MIGDTKTQANARRWKLLAATLRRQLAEALALADALEVELTAARPARDVRRCPACERDLCEVCRRAPTCAHSASGQHRVVQVGP